jgi:hypothetical protein
MQGGDSGQPGVGQPSSPIGPPVAADPGAALGDAGEPGPLPADPGVAQEEIIRLITHALADAKKLTPLSEDLGASTRGGTDPPLPADPGAAPGDAGEPGLLLRPFGYTGPPADTLPADPGAAPGDAEEQGLLLRPDWGGTGTPLPADPGAALGDAGEPGPLPADPSVTTEGAGQPGGSISQPGVGQRGGPIGPPIPADPGVATEGADTEVFPVSTPSEDTEVFPVSSATIDVSNEVFPVRQVTENVCWAAAATMMLSWQNRQSMTIETAMDSLGPGWRAVYEAGHPLTPDQNRVLLRAVGLSDEGPASYSPEGWSRMLDAYGPVWVVGAVNANGSQWMVGDDTDTSSYWLHARIVTAVWGDGTAAGTTVTLADPVTGTIYSESFTEFAKRMEARDTVRSGEGIYHF